MTWGIGAVFQRGEAVGFRSSGSGDGFGDGSGEGLEVREGLLVQRERFRKLALPSERIYKEMYTPILQPRSRLNFLQTLVGGLRSRAQAVISQQVSHRCIMVSESNSGRCRASLACIRYSGLDSDPGFHVKPIQTMKVSPLRSTTAKKHPSHES